jgi:hypothetical protein
MELQVRPSEDQTTPLESRYQAKHRTIRELLLRVFPEGTNREYAGRSAEEILRDSNLLLKDAPRWPPDLFAAMAILIEQSGCYTHPRFVQQAQVDGALKEKAIKATAKGYRSCWQTNAKACSPHEASPVCSQRGGEKCGWKEHYDDEIQVKWNEVVSQGDVKIADVGDLRGPDAPKWCGYAMHLFEIADEACVGVGFINHFHSGEPGNANPIAHHVYENQRLAYKIEHENRMNRVVNIQWTEADFGWVRSELSDGVKELYEQISNGQFMKLPYLPHSICYSVPSYIACVQPKANTPQVGYSLRSFSHNLSLVPRVGEVSTQWFNAFTSAESGNRPLNLLLVPYPYSVRATTFGPVQNEHTKFRVSQGWLMELLTDQEKDKIKRMKKEEDWRGLPDQYTDGSDWQLASIQASKISDGIRDLIIKARDNVSAVHGVILPELSLSLDVAEIASTSLFSEFPELQFFISGVLAPRQVTKGSRPINSVFTRLNMNWPSANKDSLTRIPLRRIQVKHHRWKLDRHQIIRYHLGGQLDPELNWWEDNDMIERESLFWVFRPYMVMTSLVCEDLARIDPVQQVLRAVAPNLVIALLLDGPQTPTRWASRYASALSDDPGCGVLTLTSLGMIRRDENASVAEDYIAMWKDSEGQTRLLKLPKTAAGLILTLSTKLVDEIAAGGRRKESRSLKLYFSASHSVRKPHGNVMFAGLDEV